MNRLIVFQMIITVSIWLAHETSALSSDVITLSDGHQMPLVGYGTAQVDNVKDILDAIRIGYRKIDTGFVLDNEESVGLALRKAMKFDDIKREDVFVTTKIWNTFHSTALVERQVKLSLMNLDLDYVDLLLMQYPMGYEYPGKKQEKTFFPRFQNATAKPVSWNKDDYIETWKAMEDMVRNNYTKSIGLSNFNTHQVDRILEIAEIKPVMNQIEVNVYYKQERLVKHCRRLGLQVEAYAPLHPAIKDEPIIQEIAKKYKKEPTQVALRWLLERGLSLNVKSVHKDRMKENLDIFNFNLTTDEVNDILKLQDKKKKVDDPCAHSHPDYPFNETREEDFSTTTTREDTTTEQMTSPTTSEVPITTSAVVSMIFSTTESATSQTTTESVASESITESAASQSTTESVASQTTTESVASESITESVASQSTTESVASQSTTESVESQSTPESVASESITESVASQSTTESVASQSTTESAASQPTTESAASQSATESVASQPTTESPISSQQTSVPEASTTKPAHDHPKIHGQHSHHHGHSHGKKPVETPKYVDTVSNVPSSRVPSNVAGYCRLF